MGMNAISDTATETSSAGELLEPLALTTFEEFLLNSDSPESAMVFRVVMRFHGEFDRELFEQSFSTAVARHPLLVSVIKTENTGASWHMAGEKPVLIWNDPVQVGASQECGDFIEPIDLRHQPGLRIRVSEKEDGLLIWLDVHHAACDGMGAWQLTVDWFHHYDRICLGLSPKLTTLEAERLPSRARLSSRPGIEPVGFREGVRNFYVTVCGRTARLPRRRKSTTELLPGQAFIVERVLSEDETSQLRKRLKGHGISINDLGIALSMKVFAEHFPTVNAKHFLTVLNPVDLRMPSDRYLPATNKTGFTYLRRRHHECSNLTLDKLLGSIREQTTYIKERYVAAEFIHGLNGANRWPGVLRFLQRIEWFTPTMQFTCLGDTTRGRRYGFRRDGSSVMVGHLQVDRITGFAPVAPGVPLSLTACETQSRLLLSVSASQNFVSDEQTTKFADAFREGVVKWANASNPQDGKKGAV